MQDLHPAVVGKNSKTFCHFTRFFLSRAVTKLYTLINSPIFRPDVCKKCTFAVASVACKTLAASLF